MADVGVTGGCVEMVVRAIVDLSCPVKGQLCSKEVMLGRMESYQWTSLTPMIPSCGEVTCAETVATRWLAFSRVFKGSSVSVTDTYANSVYRRGVAGACSEVDEPSRSRCAVARRCSSTQFERPPTSPAVSTSLNPMITLRLFGTYPKTPHSLCELHLVSTAGAPAGN